jgi:hypothetical protein
MGVMAMFVDSIIWSQVLPRVFVAVIVLVALVAAAWVFVRAAAWSSRHEIRSVGAVYHCSCGEVFSGLDVALQHAERRRDEGRVTGRQHPQLGHPMR